MKKILFIIAVIITSVTLNAQNKNVTKFLGIPVDGTKAEMMQKLKAKGFVSSPYDNDALVGEFNGKNVNIRVVTNNNKVYRVAVFDADEVGEADIIIRFNTLCSQFENNGKYRSDYRNNRLSEGEDISYEMRINNKTYDAMYYQLSASPETSEADIFDVSYMKRPVWFRIAEGTRYKKFYIVLFYDNEYNRANGEDL